MKYQPVLEKATMGSVSTCPATPSAVASGTSSDTKAYKWYGLHVLSAKCKGSDGTPYFEAKLNIYGLIVMGFVALVILWLVMKMMHKKSDSFEPLPVQ
jgi:hypothetical protein